MSVKNPNAGLVGERVLVNLRDGDEEVAQGGRHDKLDFEGGQYYGQTVAVIASVYDTNMGSHSQQLLLTAVSEEGNVFNIWASLIRIVDD